MNQAREMLCNHLNACQQRIEKLAWSLHKNNGLFPLETTQLAGLTNEQEESIDALILRYSQCIAMIQDQLFRGIAYAEQEDIHDKSNRDKTLLMEKLGAIPSADAFGTAAMLRNKFAHHYPEEIQTRLTRLNLVLEASKYVIATFNEITRFLKHKGVCA